MKDAKEYEFPFRILFDTLEEMESNLICGRESPHNAFRFAEDVNRGGVPKDKMDEGQMLGKQPGLLDLVAAHLKICEKKSEPPLGDAFTAWFFKIDGYEPYTETYFPDISRADISPQFPPTAEQTCMALSFPTNNTPQEYTPMNIEQDRRNQQLNEQNLPDLAHSAMPVGFRAAPVPDPAAEQDMPSGSSKQTDPFQEGNIQIEPEQENAPKGSIEVNEPTQSLPGMPGGNGNGGDPPDDIDLSKANAPAIGQALREGWLAEQSPNVTPAIDRLDDTQAIPPENEISAIERRDDTQAIPPENEISAIDRLQESPSTQEQEQQAPAQQQER